MKTGKLLRAFRDEMLKPLPGQVAHLKMAPPGRIINNPSGKKLIAGVLLLLYPKKDDWYLVFIKRQSYEGVHSGQVGYPGGRQEKGDGSLFKTAIRETHEEIGIEPGKIVPLGKLTPLYIPVSNYEVHPYVGFVKKKPKFIIDPVEVNYVIEYPLSHLLNAGNYGTKKYISNHQEYTAPSIKLGNDDLWGASLMILCEFLEIVRSISIVHAGCFYNDRIDLKFP